MSKERLWQIFDEHLELIDPILAERGTAIHRRPWEAALFFLQHCIVVISGMSKGDFVTHRGFRDMVRRSRSWYVQRFGERLVDAVGDDAICDARQNARRGRASTNLRYSNESREGRSLESGFTRVIEPRAVNRQAPGRRPESGSRPRLSTLPRQLGIRFAPGNSPAFEREIPEGG